MPTGGERVASGRQHRIGEEFTGVDRLRNSREILVDDAASAEVHVPDLGIAHLFIRQAYRETRAADQHVRILLPQAVPVGLHGVMDRVKIGAFAVAPAVEYNEERGMLNSRHGIELSTLGALLDG